jgi:hypothetical protein
MAIMVGNQYRFNYPKEFTTLPEYTAHAGQIVTVTQMVPDSDVDAEVETMWTIAAKDGWIGQAFESELEPV